MGQRGKGKRRVWQIEHTSHRQKSECMHAQVLIWEKEVEHTVNIFNLTAKPMAKYPAAVINKGIAVWCDVVGMAVLKDKQ